MSIYAQTLTRDETITRVIARHVHWKVASDLCQLRLTHELFSREFEERLAHDIFWWLYYGYAHQIEFLFYSPAGYLLHLGVSYRITIGGITTRDDDAGGLPLDPLPNGTEFAPVVTPSVKYRTASSRDKAQFHADLKLSWGQWNLLLSRNGTSVTDRLYSRGILTAQRTVYQG